MTEAQENHLPLHGAVLFIGDGGRAREDGWHEPLICISSSRPVWQRESIHHPAGGWQTHMADLWLEMPRVAAAAEMSHNHSTDRAPQCEPVLSGQRSCTATGKRCDLNGTNSTEMLSAHPQLLAQHLSMDKDWEGKKTKGKKEQNRNSCATRPLLFQGVMM